MPTSEVLGRGVLMTRLYFHLPNIVNPQMTKVIVPPIQNTVGNLREDDPSYPLTS
jgi:hypothetical protein